MLRPFRTVMMGLLLALGLVAGLSRLVFAANGGCDHCGAMTVCQKICRLVNNDRKITTTCWGYQCEDFCIPCPSTPKEKHCEMVCDENAPQKPCIQPRKLVWTEWFPSPSANVHTRKKLMKKTVTRTVPGYKWVVEELCHSCAAECQSATVSPGVTVPPVPAVASAEVLPPQMARPLEELDDAPRSLR